MNLKIISELFWKTIFENYFQVCKIVFKSILKIVNRNSISIFKI